MHRGGVVGLKCEAGEDDSQVKIERRAFSIPEIGRIRVAAIPVALFKMDNPGLTLPRHTSTAPKASSPVAVRVL